ncbi:TPA: hypothetical protein ACSCXL_000844 [Aeromonas veronii]|uniref:hypothetical protein n=1 Tax=Aeromonas veronii TaxID=654 RepID=UPI0013DDAD93|nr:hypothetical protein [Aeromonas veronii]
MKKYGFYDVVEKFLTVGTLFLVASVFPSCEAILVENSLTGFWVIPAVALVIVALLEDAIKKGFEPPVLTINLLESVAAGIGGGGSFGATLILNEWYANPNGGLYEPLFAATTLASSMFFYLSRRIKCIGDSFRNK